MTLDYLRDAAAIYEKSFATVAAEADLARFDPGMQAVATRLVHACGMPDVARNLAYGGAPVEAGTAALRADLPVFCDCEMVRAGIIARLVPDTVSVETHIRDPRVPDLARRLGTTRSAAAVEMWRDRLAGAVVVIGNAPTALFHLLEKLDAGWPAPALILAFPVGFVGAAESKAELVRDPRGTAFVTLPGRRGGSAMAAAAFNAVAGGLSA